MLRYFALLMAISFPSLTYADPFYSSSAGPSVVGPINVNIDDQAGDACWTNLREVRSYAEEKLRSKGYTIGDGGYDFYIGVVGGRGNDPGCTYAIDLNVRKSTMLDGVFGMHSIGVNFTVGYASSNTNRAVIKNVQEMIDAM